MKTKLQILIPIILLLSLANTTIEAQILGEKIIRLQGRVLDDSGKPVAYAYVINKMKHQSTITDTLGYFRIPMLKKDTLYISSIGYEKQKFFIQKEDVPANYYVEIKLPVKTYQIALIDIYEARWQDFVYEFLHTEMQTQLTPNTVKNWIEKMITPHDLAMLAASKSVPGFTINLRSKSEKQWKKRHKLEEQDEKEKKIKEKFNANIVSEVTGYTGYELLNFLKDFKIPKTEIETANDYKIIFLIKEQQKKYEAKKKEKNN